MCTSPLIRYRLKKNAPNNCPFGDYSKFNILSAKKLESMFVSYGAFKLFFDEYMDYQYIPCRKCAECKAKYAQDWSIRCYHEFQMREKASFITLTIDSSKAHLFFDDMRHYCKRCVKGNRFIKYPIDYTLCKGLLLDELKRMRDTLYKRTGVKIRYFGCGEYGEKDERPHYHILIFGYDFPDRQFYKISNKGVNIYLSEELSKFWKYGLCTVQDVNHQACMYTAKYCVKKLKYTDEQSEFEAYYGREPEFLVMSRGNCNAKRCKYIDDIIANCKGLNSLRNFDNPYCKFCDYTRGGIGYDWFKKYYKDILSIGFITIEGKKYNVPKYYLDLLKLTDLDKYDSLKLKKMLRGDDDLQRIEIDYQGHNSRNSSYSCNARRVINNIKLNLYKRN